MSALCPSHLQFWGQEKGFVLDDLCTNDKFAELAGKRQRVALRVCVHGTPENGVETVKRHKYPRVP